MVLVVLVARVKIKEINMKYLHSSVWRTRLFAGIGVALLSACTTLPQQSGSGIPNNANTAPVEPATASTSPVEESSIFSRLLESPQTTALRAQLLQQDRLYRVAAPLLTKNNLLCVGFSRKILGFTALNKYSFPPELLESAQALGFEDRLTITGVLPNSAAQQSGLQTRDVLIKVEGRNFPQGPDADRQTALLLGPIVSQKDTINMTIQRNGNNQSISIPLTPACAFNIELGNTDTVNSYDDGRRILVTRGMMQFAQNDTELAYVIASEMAHNILGHAGKQRMTATIGEIIDNLLRFKPDDTTAQGMAGVRPFPGSMDAEADRLALYMLARAGYNTDQYASFWQRLADQYPATILNAYTAIHPDLQTRLDTIQQTLTDIQSKQETNQDLVP